MHLFLLLFLLAGSALSANILVLLPFPGYSHTMPFMPIFKELGTRGHQLTLITAFPQEPAPKGFTQIPMEMNNTEVLESMMEFLGRKLLPRRVGAGPLYQLFGNTLMCPNLAHTLIRHIKPVMPPSGSKFDLIIIEPYFCMEWLIAASEIYKAPVVITLPLPLTPLSAVPVGNLLTLPYVPHVRIPFTNNMSFPERVWNTVVIFTELVINKFYYLPIQDRLMRDEFASKDLPYIEDLLERISLVLMETHFTLNYPRPYLRNVVEVGGLNLPKTMAPVPKDLEQFMSEAESGVIFFSWGSHYTEPEPGLIEQSLMQTFSGLKQRVLFKWHNSDIPNKPDNVLIKDWFPQPAILSHPNTVLFISHCGLNSMFEAVHFRVPVIGTPLFGDQPHNARLLEHFGIGVRVSVDRIEEGPEELTAAIQKVLKDPSFKKNAEKKSLALRDRPRPSLDDAVYWIEYVLKHGDSDLRPPRGIPWYSFALFDVILFLALLSAVPPLLFCLCIRFYCRRKKFMLSKDKKKKKH